MNTRLRTQSIEEFAIAINSTQMVSERRQISRLVDQSFAEMGARCARCGGDEQRASSPLCFIRDEGASLREARKDQDVSLTHGAGHVRDETQLINARMCKKGRNLLSVRRQYLPAHQQTTVLGGSRVEPTT